MDHFVLVVIFILEPNQSDLESNSGSFEFGAFWNIIQPEMI